jgi:acyl-CoA reductase-like NAD-dependent aldehyde dehydrogenase
VDSRTALMCAYSWIGIVVRGLTFPVLSGPVISPQSKQRIEGLIESCELQGGRVLLDGRKIQVCAHPQGNWVGPTILEATTDMDCYKCVLSQLDLQ